MRFRRLNTFLLILIWITGSCTQSDRARIKVNAQYKTFTISKPVVNLIKHPKTSSIYAASSQELYEINPGWKANQVSLEHFETNCIKSPVYNIRVIEERNSLYICESHRDRTICSDLASPINCYTYNNVLHTSDASLFVDKHLYLTKSRGDWTGLYRCSMNKCIWPQINQKEKKFLKIIASKGSTTLDGKVYTFYIEKNTDPDPETPVWIPKVSQICMADQGGNKQKLQHRWTSMLTARLFCGNEMKKLSYTELLDIVVVESEDWNNTTIYGLFTNAYNLRAVCSYSMTDIINTFTSNKFKGKTWEGESPGKCTGDSTKLSPTILNFMEQQPEMDSWIKPSRTALLLRHSYTKLQVDRVNSNQDVLFMSLENGKIHKVLAQDGFIISEYELFNQEQQISNMLLDSSTNKLFVSSNTSVAQVDLYNCMMYGQNCHSCVMARDPYCSWNQEQCIHKIRDVTSEDAALCKSEHEVRRSRQTQPLIISEDSTYYLQCPITSQHATYTWYHHGKPRECVLYEQDDCLLLIDHMSEEDEGVYECKASEHGFTSTINLQELKMKSSAPIRAASVVLACLLLLIPANI